MPRMPESLSSAAILGDMIQNTPMLLDDAFVLNDIEHTNLLVMEQARVSKQEEMVSSMLSLLLLNAADHQQTAGVSNEVISLFLKDKG